MRTNSLMTKKDSKNTQNISPEGSQLLFEEYLQEQEFILKINYRGTSRCFGESLTKGLL